MWLHWCISRSDRLVSFLCLCIVDKCSTEYFNIWQTKVLLCLRRLHGYLCLWLLRHRNKAVIAIHCNISQCAGGRAVTCFTHNVCGSHFLKLTFTKCPCHFRWHTLPLSLQAVLVGVYICETVVGVIAQQALRYSKHFLSWTKESLAYFVYTAVPFPKLLVLTGVLGDETVGAFALGEMVPPPPSFSAGMNDWLLSSTIVLQIFIQYSTLDCNYLSVVNFFLQNFKMLNRAPICRACIYMCVCMCTCAHFLFFIL